MPAGRAAVTPAAVARRARVPRARLPGIAGQLTGGSRWRRLAAGLGSIAAVALVVGVLAGAGLPAASKGATARTKGTGSSIVERRDLVATDTQSGTLGYANPSTVFNRLSGTITALPAAGALIKPGQTLYRVDQSPVVLFDGTVPAYRSLSAGVGDGLDVQELKQNLVALGFDPSHQITINQTFDAATISAVQAWQASLGEAQTGTVTFGQAVFLPGPQRVTTVNAALGSPGGSGTGSASGSAAGSAAGALGTATGASGSASTGATAASATAISPQTEFVSLTGVVASPAAAAPAPPVASATPAGASADPAAASAAPSGAANTTCSTPGAAAKSLPPAGRPKSTTPAGSPPAHCQLPSFQLKALLALLKAETLELGQGKPAAPTSSGSGSRTSGAGAGSAPSRASGASGVSGARGGGSGASSAVGGAGGSGGSGGGASASSAGGSAGASTAQAIMQTTSNQHVVTVALDATKQSEAVLNEPVTVQLPSGSIVNGKITHISPVAQTSSGSSSGASGGSSSGPSAGGSGSSAPSATVPVTIALSSNARVSGLDQAAVSVNFQQQSARNVLSVPVTALLATAGGGYAVQEAASPHRLISVTPGLFATGYVQISGAQVFPGLRVTDSQG